MRRMRPKSKMLLTLRVAASPSCPLHQILLKQQGSVVVGTVSDRNKYQGTKHVDKLLQ